MTTVVLAAVLITGSAWLLAWQTLAFALGAAGGVGRSPYGLLFRKAVRPRIGPPTEFEAPEPPRFAQAVGLAFAVVGLFGYRWGRSGSGSRQRGQLSPRRFSTRRSGIAWGARCTCSYGG